MKALEMAIARDLKAHKRYRLCLKCGHMNNGEEDVWKRICQCATPVLLRDEDIKKYRGVPLHEIRGMEEFRHHFGGDKERTIVAEDDVDIRSRYREF